MKVKPELGKEYIVNTPIKSFCTHNPMDRISEQLGLLFFDQMGGSMRWMPLNDDMMLEDGNMDTNATDQSSTASENPQG